MDIFFEEHKKLFVALAKGGVEFMLVGGYAVNVHGYVRTTNDMDIWVKPDNQNKLKLTAVLRAKGFDEAGLKFIEQQDFEKPFVFHIGKKPLTVDFLTKISGVTYEEANNQKMELPLKDITVPVIQLHHLILSKITTGRLQDKADVERLQEINKYKKKN
jgi:hypothetical protein